MESAQASEQALIDIMCEARSARNHKQLVVEAARLAAADPTFIYTIDPALNRFVLHGASEADLDRQFIALRDACGFDLTDGGPQVGYREKPMQGAEAEFAHSASIGMAKQSARVKIIVEPSAIEHKVTFECRARAGCVTQTVVEAVERGIRRASKSGILAGFPVRGANVALTGYSSDDTSSADAFEFAAHRAFQKALSAGSVCLFEPLMKITITMPDAYEGSVSGDLLGRRGRVMDLRADGAELTLTGVVPLASMFGYDAQLRSFTQGHGRFSMIFDRYEQVPPSPSGGPPFRPAAAMRAA